MSQRSIDRGLATIGIWIGSGIISYVNPSGVSWILTAAVVATVFVWFFGTV